MLGAGASKLTGAEQQVKGFAAMGYPNGFVYVAGVIEVLGAILLLIPKTAVYGVLLLGATMVVATLLGAEDGRLRSRADPVRVRGDNRDHRLAAPGSVPQAHRQVIAA